MLNELHKLASTLEANKIDLHSWHENYLLLPGGDNYRIWLSNSGHVTKIELLSQELAENCRKFGNNQQSFPAFNIAPLFRITSEEDKAYYDLLFEGKQKIDLDKLRSICVNNNWINKLTKKIDRCLKAGIPGMPKGSAVHSLMEITKQLTSVSFRSAIETCIWQNLENDIKTYLPILILKGNENKEPEKDIGSLSIVLDLANWENFGLPIASKKSTLQINKWLLSELINDDHDTNDENDAFGSPYSHPNKPMPKVKLIPGFEVGLRSMFSEQYCQFRYRKADDLSFPIAEENRRATKAALEWISGSDNKNITWYTIDNKAMLFAYPNKLPKVPLRLTPLFAGDGTENQEEKSDGDQFKEISKDFLRTFNALEPNEKPDNIQVFALQQIPPSLSKRAKVVYSRNLSVSNLQAALNEWQLGCKNIPSFHFVKPKTPFPLAVSKTANKVWKQDGSQADGRSGVTVMRYYQGMELFTDTPIPSQLIYIVRSLTTNWSGLVLFLANSLARENLEKITSTYYLKKETGKLMSLLGLLLYKLNSKKENYMQKTAYLLGQALKLSDSLHALYCEIKRDGDVPPQLAGNSVFIAASEMPVRALALLSTRMIPYISWAKQYRTKSEPKSGIAAWMLRQFETIMTQLHLELNEDVRFNELEKAQLFIGYLAAFPKKDKDSEKEEEIENDEQ